jgi:hemerythrin-like domain-containing protein
MTIDRRDFLQKAGGVGAAAVGWLAIPAQALSSETDPSKQEPEAEISAPEDLMREHGVLDRILLVYEEGLRRLRAEEDVSPDVFHEPAMLVRKFVEDYHEKLEERFIFPPFEKQGTEVELVAVLRQQHDGGRRLTDIVLRHAVADRFLAEDSRRAVIRACEAFIRMYRPHAAREDTVLFPALYDVIGAETVRELGEQFEEQEHRLFGDGGFAKAVDEVAAIEKQLGIHDLREFTPKL